MLTVLGVISQVISMFINLLMLTVTGVQIESVQCILNASVHRWVGTVLEQSSCDR